MINTCETEIPDSVGKCFNVYLLSKALLPRFWNIVNLSRMNQIWYWMEQMQQNWVSHKNNTFVVYFLVKLHDHWLSWQIGRLCHHKMEFTGMILGWRIILTARVCLYVPAWLVELESRFPVYPVPEEVVSGWKVSTQFSGEKCCSILQNQAENDSQGLCRLVNVWLLHQWLVPSFCHALKKVSCEVGQQLCVRRSLSTWPTQDKTWLLLLQVQTAILIPWRSKCWNCGQMKFALLQNWTNVSPDPVQVLEVHQSTPQEIFLCLLTITVPSML